MKSFLVALATILFALPFTAQAVTITTGVTPAGSGTATGGGTYATGASVTVRATANTGFQFVSWKEGATTVSTAANYTFTASVNRTLIANFAVATYTISTASAPPAGGATGGGGVYNHGATATVTATPNANYSFMNWMLATTIVSANAVYSFTANQNASLTANFSLITYSIDTSSSPAAGGTTSGGGTVNSGSSVTVVATPSAGFNFVNWTEGGSPVSTSASYTFTAGANRALVANFAAISYLIETSASPVEGGSTSGGGAYNSGDGVTVAAIANAGYNFVNWTEGGSEVSTSASYAFTAGGNRSLVANFSRITYSIGTSASPVEGGTASGGGTVNSGDSVTVVATANPGYNFVNWTEGGSEASTDANYTFTASGDRDLVANFSRITYDVTTASEPEEGGDTTGGGTYNSGDTATVEATPNSGYSFLNWMVASSVVSSDAIYSFTVSSGVDLVANFARITYAVTTAAAPVEGGEASGGGVYDSGDIGTVEARPNEGYTFVSWTADSSVVSTDAVYSFVVDADIELVANFARVTFTVSTQADPAEGGDTSGDGVYNSGDLATVAATANPGYSFLNWMLGSTLVSANAIYSFYVDSDVDLTANFTRITYAVVTQSSPAEGGATTGGGTYNSGDTATVEATPNEGYSFLNWMLGASIVSAEAVYSFSVDSDVDLTANFALNQYAVATSAAPAEGGTTSGGGTVNHGDSVTVTATANANYQFVNWTEGGAPVSNDAAYTFTATANRSLVANFALITYNLGTSASPAAGGTTSGGGTVNSGDSVTVTATASANYQFVNWTEGGALVSNSASYTFTAAANRNLVANFVLITYTIGTSASPAAGGTTSGGGTVNSGDSVTVTATPNANYQFVNWTEGGAPVSNSASYTFTAAANRNLVANFALITYTIGTSASPAAGGTPSGGGVVNSGDSVTVTATAYANYQFVNWTEGGAPVSTSAAYTFTATANRSLVANFALITYTIGTSAAPAAGGTTSGGGVYNAGSSATVVATPSANYRFVNWLDGGTAVSASASYTFTVTGNRSLIANFAIITYTITTSAVPAVGGSTSGGGVIASGTTATVVAMPSAGYHFVNWTEGGTAVSGAASYSFTVTGNRSLAANFAPNTFNIATSASPAAGGTTSGGGTYNAGAIVTVTAAANAGYAFSKWTEGGATVSTSASYTITVGANRNLVANFTVVPGGGGTLSLFQIASPVFGGLQTVGLVTLAAPAPAGGATVQLTSSNGTLVRVPATVLVQAGKTSALFAVPTGRVSRITAVTVTAKLGASQKTEKVILLPTR